MRFDLHTHSTASDGKLSPTELFSRVSELSLDLFALTDHDTLNGYLDLQAQGLLQQAPYFIPGVEFSALAEKLNVHIVALDFDPTNPALQSLLQQQAERRERRAKQIAERLLKLGLPDLYPAALARADSSESVGRPHFAAAMVDLGICKSIQQAFDKWLGNGKRGDVKLLWPSLAEVIEAVHAAGGVCVLAHPLRYQLTLSKVRSLIALFAAAGGDAIEVVGQQAKPEQLKHLVKVALQFGLAASGGSDFHDPKWAWAALGKVDPLPVNMLPVWALFQHTKLSN